MKALHCRNCNSLRSLHASGQATTCECGQVKAWYTDADNGLAVIQAEDKAIAQLLSINNAWLNDACDLIPTEYLDVTTQQMLPYSPEQIDTFWRELNIQGAIMPRAPETVRIWDASRRACPVAFIQPGTAVDAQWAHDK